MFRFSFFDLWVLFGNCNNNPLKPILEKAMAPHSSTLAWKIPWMEEPGGLQSMGSLGVRLDWAASLSLFTFMHWRRKWQPTPVFLPGESQGQEAWWAAIYGVAQSWRDLAAAAAASPFYRCLLVVLYHSISYFDERVTVSSKRYLGNSIQTTFLGFISKIFSRLC